MPSSQDGNLGLWSGYTAGDNGWTAQHNFNWDALDALGQLSVIDNATPTPPGSPANGAAYIVPAGATGAWASQTNKVAVWFSRSTAAWQFFTPKNGWMSWVQSQGGPFVYNGSAWVSITGRLLNIQKFTAAGTSTYTPTAGTNKVRVLVYGGGGGGGGCATPSAGAGGCAGGVACSYLTAGFSGVTVTVGAAGTGGAAGNNAGTAGGTSSFGSLLSATGGSGGGGGGAIGSASAIAGQSAGGSGSGGNIFNGIGGSGGYSFALSTTSVFSGAGGMSFLSAGSNGIIIGSSSTQINGGNAVGPASGGAGGASTSGGTAAAGGNGAAGIVVIEEYS